MWLLCRFALFRASVSTPLHYGISDHLLWDFASDFYLRLAFSIRHDTSLSTAFYPLLSIGLLLSASSFSVLCQCQLWSFCHLYNVINHLYKLTNEPIVCSVIALRSSAKGLCYVFDHIFLRLWITASTVLNNVFKSIGIDSAY